MHAVFRRGLEPQCRLGVEVPGALAAHDHVAVPVLLQPLHPVLGGDAASITTRARVGVECLEHLGARVVLAHVAGEHLGTRTKPLPSSTSAKVSSGQSVRLSLSVHAAPWAARAPRPRSRYCSGRTA